jgi:Arc/MetJ family transcription regulator
MRTNIDIDDELMAEAMKATGKKTKKATVEEALRQIVRQNRQRQALKDLEGLGWEGDLDEMRRGFFRDFDELPSARELE